MNRFSLFAFLLFLSLGLRAQTYFNNRIDLNNTIDGGTNIIKDSANFLIFGFSIDTATYMGSILNTISNLSVTKINSSGTTISKKLISNPSNVKGVGYYPTKVIRSGISNYLCACPKYDTSTSMFSILIYKLDKNFDTICTKSYAHLKMPSGYNTIHADSTDQKGMFIFGAEYPGLLPFVIKTDSMGNVLWKKNYTNPYFYANPYFIKSMSKGGLVVGYSIGTNGTPPQQYDEITMCLDSSGNQLWSLNSFSSSSPPINSTSPLKVIQTKSKGYLLLSENYYQQTPMTNTIITSKITKVDSLRNVIWTKIFYSPYNASFTNAIESADSSFFLSGNRKNPTTNLFEGVTAKLSKMGDSLLFDTINYNSTLNCWFTDMQQTSMGGFILSGYIDSTQFGTSKTDFWVVGVDSNGCYTSNCVTGLQRITNKENEINIYPIPCNENLTIQSSKDIESVIVCNCLGDIIMAQSINSNVINVSNLNNGVYFLELKTKDGGLIRKKFIKD